MVVSCGDAMEYVGVLEGSAVRVFCAQAAAADNEQIANIARYFIVFTLGLYSLIPDANTILGRGPHRNEDRLRIRCSGPRVSYSVDWRERIRSGR